MKKFNEADQAVYFASADKQTQLAGFGVADELKNWQQPSELANWLAQQTQLVFGGVPFDEQKQDSVLMNGYFFAPAETVDLRQVPNDSVQTPLQSNAVLKEDQEVDWVDRMTPTLTTLQREVDKEKVVLGMQTTLQLAHPLDLGQLIADLQVKQPNSYHFVLKRGDEAFISATPERLVRLAGQHFETAAVAGSIKRGENQAKDAALASQLWHDPKNRTEHAVVVDTIANVLSDLATLHYDKEPTLLKTPQIQHLYTPIQGELAENTSLPELLERLHPTPALGGFPKDWAQAVIKSVEAQPRGLFAAPIGYLEPNGMGEFVVGIRSMWQKGTEVHLFAGAGILPDSDLAQEAQEIQLKMTPMKELIEAQQ
ncbi:isochorismate synthase [Weissella uvarum]|nr:isochorismate synthase [Weissella uvarum]